MTPLPISRSFVLSMTVPHKTVIKLAARLRFFTSLKKRLPCKFSSVVESMVDSSSS